MRRPKHPSTPHCCIAAVIQHCPWHARSARTTGDYRMCAIDSRISLQRPSKRPNIPSTSAHRCCNLKTTPCWSRRVTRGQKRRKQPAECLLYWSVGQNQRCNHSHIDQVFNHDFQTFKHSHIEETLFSCTQAWPIHWPPRTVSVIMTNSDLAHPL